jgi:asparagine synthase (glutamine-hydrolysing)
MCGIFAAVDSKLSIETLEDWSSKVAHRGPDNEQFKVINDRISFGFHRLRINGVNSQSDQPMHLDGIYLIANAEVFNHKELEEKYDFDVKTKSDCEVILHMYKRLGFEQTIKELDAEFAIVLYDSHKDIVYAARDHIGIRGMYIGKQGEEKYFASEAKALTFCDTVKHFPPRSYYRSDTDQFYTYYELDFKIHTEQEEELHLENINKLLVSSVKKRMMSDRNIGCLLSGGLDSSLISAIVAREADKPTDVQTFSIGMEGSPDLAAAKKVADHIGTTHHSILASEETFIEALEQTVHICGSYDVTTIRASVGHQLVSNWVKENSDVKVLFSGETADEFGSYLYFQNAPSPEAFQKEAVRLLSDIHYFDNLRGDRSISSAGLEARVPFADKAFMAYYMGIHPAQRMFNDQKMEKYLIRKAFEKENLLPDEVLWRRKNGFSDSVSKKDKSWSTVIKEYVDKQVTDAEYDSQKSQFTFNPPQTKEAYYYRSIFHKLYGDACDQLTPYQWLPKWCGEVLDPSARVLSIYEAD